MQKKNYREEKKRATKELLSTITDPSVIVMADWLKVVSVPNLRDYAKHVLGRAEILFLLDGCYCRNSAIEQTVLEF